ncbi:hypothetical protein BDW02DRAFT_228942 [Decorospora gaudefroyi]|uniref:Uncharacterized protein n=1 Tax=Decorospora gaudefroyi TaxID=184978 RepID=A0A6A5KSE0_9PLEO|nr:hypothetical protein BDW02DRAFT_228942 [Decorospora gaudefroyi]
MHILGKYLGLGKSNVASWELGGKSVWTWYSKCQRQMSSTQFENPTIQTLIPSPLISNSSSRYTLPILFLTREYLLHLGINPNKQKTIYTIPYPTTHHLSPSLPFVFLYPPVRRKKSLLSTPNECYLLQGVSCTNDFCLHNSRSVVPSFILFFVSDLSSKGTCQEYSFF